MYSITFFGGPKDGEILFQSLKPSEMHYETIGDIVTSNHNSIEAHLYQGKLIGPFWFKYYYRGVTEI
jgi:hypothetical protein